MRCCGCLFDRVCLSTSVVLLCLVLLRFALLVFASLVGLLCDSVCDCLLACFDCFDLIACSLAYSHATHAAQLLQERSFGGFSYKPAPPANETHEKTKLVLTTPRHAHSQTTKSKRASARRQINRQAHAHTKKQP